MDSPKEAPSLVVDSPSEDLYRRARGGDGGALDQLFARYLPRLRRWAHGRVPTWARDSFDTGDLVQETALKAYANLPRFQARHRGALFSYLRTALRNRINDQFRHVARHPTPQPLDDVCLDAAGVDPAASPLESAIVDEDRRRYEAALKRLRRSDREAVIGRVEMGYSYEQLAVLIGKPTPEAARLAVRRALLRLKAEVDAERT